MTVGELKEMLSEATDDMEVLLPGAEVFDGFFKSPCPEESGVVEMPDLTEEQQEELMHVDPEDIDESLYPTKKVFLLAHHGFSEHPEGVEPSLN